MSAVEFASMALRDVIAPPSNGSVKVRRNRAAVRLRWSLSRLKSVWYADPAVRLSADELRAIENASGLTYAHQELANVETIIARADALLEGSDPDFHSAFVAAIRAVAHLVDRTGTEG